MWDTECPTFLFCGDFWYNKNMTKELIKIRKSNKKDSSQLEKFCFEAHKELSKFSKDIVVNKKTRQAIKKEKNAQEEFYKTFVAEKDGKVVGNASLFFAPGLRNEGTIFNVFVSKHQRRQGIGSKLVTEAAKWLEKHEIKEIRMVVHRKNKVGLLFLRKLKFKKEPIKVFWMAKSI